MKLLVFGGSGRIGGALVNQALAGGHQVTVATRRPDALTARHDRLDVAYADVLSGDGLDDLVVGKEAVIFAVGSPNRKTTLVYSDGIHNVAEAMGAAGVARLVSLSSTIAEVPDRGLIRPLWIRLVVDKVLRNRLLDMARMEDELRVSGLDWTVVRLPGLRGGPGGPGAARPAAGGPGAGGPGAGRPAAGGPGGGRPARRVREAVNARLAYPHPLTVPAVAGWVLAHLDDPAVFRAVVEIGS
jgi:nucleoside-diphosphate-sugar epimerase